MSFKHKGLEKLWLSGSAAGIPPQRREKIRAILSALAAAERPSDMNLAGLRLHRWSSPPRPWSVDVSGNVRILFQWRGGHAEDVDLHDPH